jgi:CheY-like chemotaxis protein
MAHLQIAQGEAADVQFAREFPLKILIADDNYINRRVLCLLLIRLGYEAKSMENGQECLEEVLKNPYDLLLLDIDMPIMSGIECTQSIRQEGLDLPIIAVTATSPEVTRGPCFEAGMNGYMSKPVNLPELKRILRETSERKVARQAA